MKELTIDNLKDIARDGFMAAANAYRLYPDNKHTFVDYWDNLGKDYAQQFLDETESQSSAPDTLIPALEEISLGKLSLENIKFIAEQAIIKFKANSPLPNQKGDMEDEELDKIIEEIETSSHVHSRHLLRKLINKGK